MHKIYGDRRDFPIGSLVIFNASWENVDFAFDSDTMQEPKKVTGWPTFWGVGIDDDIVTIEYVGAVNICYLTLFKRPSKPLLTIE